MQHAFALTCSYNQKLKPYLYLKPKVFRAPINVFFMYFHNSSRMRDKVSMKLFNSSIVTSLCLVVISCELTSGG